jgi:hypothetical protein
MTNYLREQIDRKKKEIAKQADNLYTIHPPKSDLILLYEVVDKQGRGIWGGERRAAALLGSRPMVLAPSTWCAKADVIARPHASSALRRSEEEADRRTINKLRDKEPLYYRCLVEVFKAWCRKTQNTSEILPEVQNVFSKEGVTSVRTYE